MFRIRIQCLPLKAECESRIIPGCKPVPVSFRKKDTLTAYGKTAETYCTVKRNVWNRHTFARTIPFLLPVLPDKEGFQYLRSRFFRGQSSSLRNGRRHAGSMPPQGCSTCVQLPDVAPASFLPDCSAHQWRRQDALLRSAKWTYPEWETGKRVLRRKSERCPPGA